VPQLAPVPGPLPFDTTARRMPARRSRGRVASALLLVLAAALFFSAAGGGFALARVVGGQPLLPPSRTSAPPSTQPPGKPVADLETRTGDAATVNGAQGGEYSVRVPGDWERFVEERATDEVTSTRVYFVSTDGTQMLTLERFTGYLQGQTVDDYIDSLDDDPDVSVNFSEKSPTKGLQGGGQGLHLTYQTLAKASDLAPGVPGARNVNRTTFANLLPLGDDLWVAAVTVPVDQEDTGRKQLFERIAPTFTVTN
jgi:hypothetical protein